MSWLKAWNKFFSEVPTSGSSRDNAIVALENQVVQFGGGDRPQGRQFGRGIVSVEDVEGPDPYGAAAQVRVVKGVAVEGLQGDRGDAGLLLQPPQGPECRAVSVGRPGDTGGGDGAAAQLGKVPQQPAQMCAARS
jgi:hypothetical protein